MAEYNEQISQNTIKYLYNVSSVVPPHLTTLKSLYTTRFRIGEERGNVFLAAHKDRTKLSCPRCCLRLAEGPSGCVIKSEKKPSKFAKQVNSKAENGKALSNYQRLYFKKLNLNRNQLITTCSYCRHEIPRLLTKPVRATPLNVDINESILNKKKRKKKKDKFCGLDQSVVSLLTPPVKSAAVTIDLVTPTPAIKRPKLKSPKKLTPKKKTKAQQDEKTPTNTLQNKELGNKNTLQNNKKLGNNNKKQTPGNKKTTPQKLGNNNDAQTPKNKKTTPQKLGNKNKGPTPKNKKMPSLKLGNNNQVQKATPKSAAKKNKAKKENRKKLSNLVANANNCTKKSLNNFLQFFH